MFAFRILIILSCVSPCLGMVQEEPELEFYKLELSPNRSCALPANCKTGEPLFQKICKSPEMKRKLRSNSTIGKKETTETAKTKTKAFIQSFGKKK